MKKLVDFYIGALDCRPLTNHWELSSSRFIAILKRDEQLAQLVAVVPLVYVRYRNERIVFKCNMTRYGIFPTEIRVGIRL